MYTPSLPKAHPQLEPASPEARLSRNLDLIAAMANKAGAEGIFIIRGASEPILGFTIADGPDHRSKMALAEADVLLVMRFPEGDGGQPGVEQK